MAMTSEAGFEATPPETYAHPEVWTARRKQHDVMT